MRNGVFFMIARGLVLALGLCVLAGCGAVQPLERGVQDGVVVSTARPALSLSANLPLLTSFHGTPQIETINGMQSCEIWGAVYGSGPDAPLAIAALAVTPPAWIWDLPPVMLTGPALTELELGGQMFSAQTLLVSAVRDPFAGLVLPAGATGQTVTRWLTRQFTTLDAFRTSKIILEYREPLAEEQAMPGQRELEAFATRAKAAFVVSFAPPAAFTAPKLWFGSVQAQFFTRFIGQMQPESALKMFD